jgi:hypothetical protein
MRRLAMLANVQSCGREGCSCDNENKKNEMKMDSDDVCQVTASQKSEVTSQKVPKLSSTSHLNSVTPLSLKVRYRLLHVPGNRTLEVLLKNTWTLPRAPRPRPSPSE